MIRTVVIDDETISRDLMVKAIGRTSKIIEVVGVASDGIEALELIQEQQPEVAMIDVVMPGLSGLDVIRKVVKNNQKTIFVVISGHASFNFARDCVWQV